MVCAFERFKVKRPIGDAVRAVELHLFDQLSDLIKLRPQPLIPDDQHCLSVLGCTQSFA
jgi:hypothetical protein